MKERVCMTQGHGQQGVDSLREQGVVGKGRTMGENWDNSHRTIK